MAINFDLIKVAASYVRCARLTWYCNFFICIIITKLMTANVSCIKNYKTELRIFFGNYGLFFPFELRYMILIAYQVGILFWILLHISTKINENTLLLLKITNIVKKYMQSESTLILFKEPLYMLVSHDSHAVLQYWIRAGS